jgi:ABC-type nitrate/sulfonate/bicarbonate transport system permease component
VLSAEAFMLIASPVALLALWEIVVAVGVVDGRFLPPPTRVFDELVRALQSGRLLADTGWSLFRISAGFTIGAVSGIVIGALVGMSRTLRSLVGPLFAAMYSVPKTALLPVLVLVFGFSETSKITLLALSAFFLVQINTAHGVLTIPRVLFEVADDCGVRRFTFIRTVAIPGALPYIIAGLRMAWTVGFIIVVFVEMQATSEGLGAFIMESWRLFQVDRMMAGLFVLAVLGLVSNLIFDAATRWLIPWKSVQR